MRVFLMVGVLVLGSAAAQAASGSKPNAAAEPMSVATESKQDKECRRIEITGSLVRKSRVCKTRAEWRRLDDAGNDGARDIIDASRTRVSGQ